MRRVGIVFVGGGLGASLRALVLAWLAPAGSSFPVLLINLLGAFALGVVFVLADEVGLLHAETRFFLAVGVLGGFTTFSTFGWGADLLLASHASDVVVNYVVASIGGGVAAVAAGLATGRELVGILEARGSRRLAAARAATDTAETEDQEESA